MRRVLMVAILAGLVVLAAAGWIAFRLYDEHRFEAQRRLAERDLAAKRFAKARDRLLPLHASRPGRGDIEFALGRCEQALGHGDLALAAWARVPETSPLAARAALLSAHERLGRDQFSEAEAQLHAALRRPGSHSLEAWQTLAYLLKVEGRLDEVRGLFRAHWPELPNPVAGLQELWRLDNYAYPVEQFRAKLERAYRWAPEDAGVWLGRINLALRAGSLDEAGRLLAALPERGGTAPMVWRARLERARLEWARAADRPEKARGALDHVTPDAFDPAEWHALAAWFAARRGDLAAERTALEAAVATAPATRGALDRLVEIALRDRRADAAARLRQRKTDLDQARARYESLVLGPDPLAHAAELMTLAEATGQPFEARAWASLAAYRDPADPAPRLFLNRTGSQAVSAREASALVLAALRAELARVSSRPATRTESAEGVVIPTYADDALAAGLRFAYDAGQTARRQLPETMGGGVGLLDYDGDGWLDVYVVQGGVFPPGPDPPKGSDRLFRNRRDGTFEDATAASGLAGLARGYGHGVAVGDYDNDGDPDLFVTRWRAYALYRNNGDGTFTDATNAAGLDGDRDWPTSAAWADLDGDGDLDLYVCHYLRWDEQHPKICRHPDNQKVISCPPRDFSALPDHLFRNDGGRFTDVSAEAGIADTDGRGLGVIAADLDGDRRVDLFVANDMSANFFLRNQGGLRFAELGQTAGLAGSAEGLYKAGMGVGCADVDGDGLVDLAVGNFYGESATFYRNLGAGLFADQTAAVGLAAPTRYVLSFGLAFLDANNDSRPDLAIANGHLDDLRPAAPFAMPAQLFLGEPAGRFGDASARAGAPFGVPRIGRGLAIGDLDNDGRVDLVLVALDGPLAFFHNRTESSGHWLTLRLQGTKSNRDAVGAVVSLQAGGRRQVVQRFGGGSYQSASEARLHFGLGPAQRIESLEVAWPTGRIDRHENLKADTAYLMCEGEARPRPLPGFAKKP